MSPKLKARWIKALRSGRYKQCRLVTQDKDGYNCCLGVLGRIVHQKNLIGNSGRAPLPSKILDFATQDLLARMNDAGHTFNMIADYVEQYVS